MARARLAHCILKGVAHLATAGVLCLVAFVVALRLEHGMPTTLPTPTGPFAVARTIDAWRDDAADSLAPAPNTKRELLVWLWYPSVRGPSDPVADYVPDPMRAAVER